MKNKCNEDCALIRFIKILFKDGVYIFFALLLRKTTFMSSRQG